MATTANNPIRDILSIKYCLLIFGLFASCASPGRTKSLRIALVLGQQHAGLTMRLQGHAVQLRRCNPKVRLIVVSWREFRAAYPRYDAVIYIALHSRLPSKHSVEEWIGPDTQNTSIEQKGQNSAEPPLFRLLRSPVLAKFRKPRSFVWLLFESPDTLDRYRLHYGHLPYTSSNTGEAALRRIFEKDLHVFIQNLKELYF